MSPQGVLFIAIPNMRGLIRPYKLLVDKANLEIHNLESMRLSVFRDFAERNHLTTHLLEYQSGFPANVHQALNVTQKLIYYPTKFLAKRLDPLIQRRPAGLYSGEIVAMFTR